MVHTHHTLGNNSILGWPKDRTARASSGCEIASIAKHTQQQQNKAKCILCVENNETPQNMPGRNL